MLRGVGQRSWPVVVLLTACALEAFAGPVLLQTAATGGTGPVDLAFPDASVAGNTVLVVAVTQFNAIIAISDSAGNAYTPVGPLAVDMNGSALSLFWSPSIDAGPSPLGIHCESTADSMACLSFEYSGLSKARIVDQQTFSLQTQVGVTDAGSLSSIAAGDLLVFAAFASDVGEASPSPWTLRGRPVGVGKAIIEDLVSTAPGAYPMLFSSGDFQTVGLGVALSASTGSTVVDAGTVPPDSGVTFDGGAVVMPDASVNGSDGGAVGQRDGGTAELDAGSALRGPLALGVGCSCQSSESSLLVMLAVCVVWRRKPGDEVSRRSEDERDFGRVRSSARSFAPARVHRCARGSKPLARSSLTRRE